jgi:hypothetical protein
MIAWGPLSDGCYWPAFAFVSTYRVHIQWFLEDQALSLSYDLAPPFPHHLPPANCVSFSVFLSVAGRAYWQKRGGGEGSQIIRWHRSLVLYKSFSLYYSLWLLPWSGETHYDSVLSDSMEEEEASCQVFFIFFIFMFFIYYFIFLQIFVLVVLEIFVVFYFLNSFSPKITNTAISTISDQIIGKFYFFVW